MHPRGSSLLPRHAVGASGSEAVVVHGLTSLCAVPLCISVPRPRSEIFVDRFRAAMKKQSSANETITAFRGIPDSMLQTGRIQRKTKLGGHSGKPREFNGEAKDHG